MGRSGRATGFVGFYHEGISPHPNRHRPQLALASIDLFGDQGGSLSPQPSRSPWSKCALWPSAAPYASAARPLANLPDAGLPRKRLLP